MIYKAYKPNVTMWGGIGLFCFALFCFFCYCGVWSHNSLYNCLDFRDPQILVYRSVSVTIRAGETHYNGQQQQLLNVFSLGELGCRQKIQQSFTLAIDCLIQLSSFI